VGSFVSNANGEIIYERALDRDAHMVFGFIYSRPVRARLPPAWPDSSGLTASPAAAQFAGELRVHPLRTTRGGKIASLIETEEPAGAAGPRRRLFGKASAIIPAGEVIQLLSLDADRQEHDR